MEQMAVIGPEGNGPRKSLLERILSVVCEVKPGEGIGALLLCLNLFVLLGAYYLLKPVRESLVLAEGGAEWTAYSSAAQAVLLLGVVPLYGWIAQHLNRIRLLRWTTLFFASNLLIFYVLGLRGVHEGVAFYIWIGIFNVFSVAQLWAFASDLFNEEQGKRLFPLLGVGASVGSVAGAWLASDAFKKVGPYSIMLIGAVALCVCTALTRLAGYAVVRREGEEEQRKDKETLSTTGGFELLLKDRYLMLLGILTVLLNFVSLSGDFILKTMVVNHTNEVVGTAATLMKARKAYIGEFFAHYYAWTNLVSFLVQTLFVSRLFRWIGIGGSLFVMPLLSAATFISILVAPVLGVVRILKIGENATNYSLQNTVRHALLLPTSREAKYKAKAAIDTFCWRLGDVLQAGVIALGTHVLHFSVRQFSALTLLVAVVWVVVAMLLFRKYRQLTQQPSDPQPGIVAQPLATAEAH
ncbi:NTP/NDP exchange transporter [Silvibacterium sp.]|uniref:NTP/NDP exchange transporter n=1 Tax=Silvibacterium sp. TaxID=1964179 RepID=UPI0039E306BE